MKVSITFDAPRDSCSNQNTLFPLSYKQPPHNNDTTNTCLLQQGHTITNVSLISFNKTQIALWSMFDNQNATSKNAKDK